MQWSLFVLILMGQCAFFTCHLYEYHFINDTKTWTAAQSYCREHYTDLATVTNKTDMKRLNNVTEGADGAWIGLHNEPGNGNGKWRWSLPGVEFNGSEVKWDGRPNNDKDCVKLHNNDKWKAVKCTDENRFICYDDKVILIKEKKTWEQALNYCREHHGDLVSITNCHQQRWVQERAKQADTDHVWVGLLYSCFLDLWFWVDDNLVCYNNWAPGQGAREGCGRAAAMRKGGAHEWITKSDTETFNFICTVKTCPPPGT